MTDNEIKKALEWLKSKTKEYCEQCAYINSEICDICIFSKIELALDLINRLQAENESLKIANKEQEVAIEKSQKLVEQTDANCRRAINLIGGYERQLETAKAEAYKEFFNLVHSEFKTISDYQYGKLNMTFCSNFQVAIDKLREIYRKLEGGTSV